MFAERIYFASAAIVLCLPGTQWSAVCVAQNMHPSFLSAATCSAGDGGRGRGGGVGGRGSLVTVHKPLNLTASIQHDRIAIV